MNRPTYHELLKDGRWQRKRLEIMQRDGFICRECGTSNNLNVHHIRYINGRKPWEYDDDNLITLCGSCHKKTHDDIKDKEDLEHLYRLHGLRDVLLYYEKIGECEGVITSFSEVIEYCYYEVNFYYENTSPIMLDIEDEWWKLSPYPGQGYNLRYNSDDCAKIMDYIFENPPAKVLPKSAVENLHKICEYHEDWLMPDDDETRMLLSIMNGSIKRIEERYDKMDFYERYYLGIQ